MHCSLNSRCLLASCVTAGLAASLPGCLELVYLGSYGDSRGQQPAAQGDSPPPDPCQGIVIEQSTGEVNTCTGTLGCCQYLALDADSDNDCCAPGQEVACISHPAGYSLTCCTCDDCDATSEFCNPVSCACEPKAS